MSAQGNVKEQLVDGVVEVATVEPAQTETVEPQIHLSWSVDDFLTDEESEQAIKSHNDALDGPAGKGDEGDEGDEGDLEVENVIEQESEQALENDVEVQDDGPTVDEPFLGFSSARSFMGSGQSFESALNGLRKPSMKAADPLAAAGQAMDQVEEMNAQQRQQPNANADDRLQMNLGKAALMMGGMGLLKLGEMMGKGAGLMGKGAGVIGNQISRYQMTRAEKEMSESLSVLSNSLDGLRSQGLGQLDDKGVSLAERQEMAKQFFAQPGNGKALEAMFDNVTKMKRQARILIEKGVNAGDSADAVMDRVLEPMRRLTEQNEPFLESLKMGGDTLLDKMDNAMNSLFEILKSMFQKLTNTLGLGSGAAAKQSGPSMG